MNNWPTMPLGEVCFAKSGNSKIIKGTLPTENTGRLYPAYSATGQDVFSDDFDFEGDGIIISAVGARCGKCFLANGKWRAIANTHVILPKPDKANTRFLWYLLNDESFWVKGGTAQPFVKVGDSLKKKVALPSLIEQERIVKLLDEADELRKLRAQTDRRTAALIPALFREIFGDPDTNPKGWPVSLFGELLAEPLRNGLSPAKNGTFSAKIFTLSAITGETFDSFAWKEGSFARQPDKNCRAIENLFLICRGNGNRELVGRAKFPQRGCGDVVFPDTMIAGVPKTDRLLPLFLEEAWKLPSTRGQISSGARTTNGTFKINQTVIEQIRLTVPPLELQKEFAQRATKIRELEASQATSRTRLDALFQSMLHRAFNGNL